MSDYRRAAVLVYPGFDELDAFGPYEVLRMAGEFDAHLVVADSAVEVTASHDTVLRPEQRLDAGRWDFVVVPGGGWARRQGAFLAVNEGVIPDLIRKVHAAGATVTSVCTGAMILAAGGLTHGRPATTHPNAIEALSGYGTQVVNSRVVDDGDLVTAGGITSGLDLGLWLVERFRGAELADKIAARLQYQRVRDVYRGPRSQRPAAATGVHR